MANILYYSLGADHGLLQGALNEFLESTVYLEILWFTLWQAVLSTILTFFLALPAAYLFARYQFIGKSFLTAFTTVPFVLPTVVVAAAFQALLGPQGVVNNILMGLFDLAHPPIRLDRTIWMILMAHVFYNFMIVVRMVGGFWKNLNPRIRESALILGATPWQTFSKITLPLLRPAIVTAALLVFVFCFSSFGVVLILGGPQFATLEVEIYQQALHMFNLPVAALLSVLQIAFTYMVMAAFSHFQKRATNQLTWVAAENTIQVPHTWCQKVVVGTIVTYQILLLGTPLLALFIRSVWDGQQLSLKYYWALIESGTTSLFFVPLRQALFNSIGFGLLTVLAALFFGGLAAGFLSISRKGRLSFLDPMLMLPLSTSAVTLGLGFILAFDAPPLNLRTSIWLVPLSHSLVAFPFVIRSLLPALQSIPESLREAARTLGARPWQVRYHVDRPILLRALVVGAVFAFAVSMGEFGASVFVARPHTPTLPLAIYRLLGQPGAINYGQAMAMSTLLMLVTGGGFMLIEKLRVGPIHDF